MNRAAQMNQQAALWSPNVNAWPPCSHHKCGNYDNTPACRPERSPVYGSHALDTAHSSLTTRFPCDVHKGGFAVYAEYIPHEVYTPDARRPRRGR
jgi:hypothetical protein